MNDKFFYPHECKHCNADGVHCDKTREPAGEYTWVYPCHLLEFPCPDFTPKITKETIEKAMHKSWCEYRNMEYVPGFVNPLPSDNFEKGFMLAIKWILSQHTELIK